MKKLVLFTILFSATMAATAQKTTTKTPVKKVVPAPMMKNLLDSFSYAAGINVANNMKDQGILQLNTEVMLRAMDDVFKNKPLSLTAESNNSVLQRQLEIFAKDKAESEMAKGKAFLEQNKKNKGVVTLPDGLQYLVMNQGDPAANKPKAYDTVVVNYTGSFIDGREFDNSYKRGKPTVYPVSGFVKGWIEILQLMPVGAKWKVFIPSELGYGVAGYGNGTIPPNSVLVFELSLEGIKPGTEPAPVK
jgi:FKBP-type peptidyl-prolyl cis-trans isomerase FklB